MMADFFGANMRFSASMIYETSKSYQCIRRRNIAFYVITFNPTTLHYFYYTLAYSSAWN